MKQFLKFTLASCLGISVAIIFFLVFSLIIIGAMVSSIDQPGTVDITNPSVLEIKLNNAVPEQTNNTPPTGFSAEDVIGAHDIARLIDHAVTDDKITGLLLRTEVVQMGPVTSDEIIEAIESFKESGKPVLAYGNYFNQSGYKIASAADHIILNPSGNIDFKGFGILMPFFKNTLDDIGIKMQVFYAGDFKGATEPFRRTDLSEENRQQYSEYLETSFDLYLSEIAENRGLEKDRLRYLADNYLIRLAEDALTNGMVDQIGYSSDALDYLREKLDQDADDRIYTTTLQRYYKSVGNLTDYSSDNRIAVLYAEGDIIPGKNQPGQIAERDYIQHIRQIKRRSGVKAVVLRVNSPGGSSLTSDVILNELDLLKEEGIPLVVSMGDYAASGGYYISAHADKIVASPNTLTGSIGVFATVPNARGFLEGKMGITFDTVGTGKYTNRMNLIYAFNEDESQIIQNQIDHIYNQFLNIVSEGRNMAKAEVHEIAQGRVWTGERAVTLGLADTLGDLDAALGIAANLAEIDNYRIDEYPKPKNRWQQIMEMYLGDDAWETKVLKKHLGQHYTVYEDMQSIFMTKGPVARLPFVLQH